MRYKNQEKILEERIYETKEGRELPLLTFSMLENIPGIRHCFTTRAGGVSQGIFRSLNLSFTRGDDGAAVLENYRRVASAMGTDITQVVTSDQTHTTNIRLASRADAGKGVVRPRDYLDVDGLITDTPGLLLAAFFADCVPLYMVDPRHRAIGLFHSGWRGTAERMGEKGVRAMADAFGSRPKDLICAIGPSICGDCYQIGEDVAEIFAERFPECRGQILRRDERGDIYLDLWQANLRILLDAGVPEQQIAVTNLCTCCNPEELFSHRASGGKRGNLGAFLMLVPES